MTKVKQAVVRFIENGGSVSDCGNFVRGISGKILKQIDRQGYPSVNVYLPESGHRHPVHVHKIVAYIKYKEEFLSAELVRHLDGNSKNNSLSNIAIGTSSDNSMDRLAEARKISAQIAGKAASKYTDDFWVKIKSDYESGLSYKKLRKKYGVPLGTLSYQLSSTAKKKKFLITSSEHRTPGAVVRRTEEFDG